MIFYIRITRFCTTKEEKSYDDGKETMEEVGENCRQSDLLRLKKDKDLWKERELILLKSSEIVLNLGKYRDKNLIQKYNQTKLDIMSD